jgi:hypothetical protein
MTRKYTDMKLWFRPEPLLDGCPAFSEIDNQRGTENMSLADLELLRNCAYDIHKIGTVYCHGDFESFRHPTYSIYCETEKAFNDLMQRLEKLVNRADGVIRHATTRRRLADLVEELKEQGYEEEDIKSFVAARLSTEEEEA